MTSAFDFPAWAHVLFRPVKAELASMVAPPPPRQKPGPKPGSKRKPKEPK